MFYLLTSLVLCFLEIIYTEHKLYFKVYSSLDYD